MKKTSAALLVAATLAAASLPGCYGSYSAFNGVRKWNGGASDNKVARSAIHFALWIIPVYELSIVGDFLIFNTVEFFSGKPVFGGGASGS